MILYGVSILYYGVASLVIKQRNARCLAAINWILMFIAIIYSFVGKSKCGHGKITEEAKNNESVQYLQTIGFSMYIMRGLVLFICSAGLLLVGCLLIFYACFTCCFRGNIQHIYGGNRDQ